jgi:hypothetical protein
MMPESAHAIRVAIDETLRCKECGEKKVIAFDGAGGGGDGAFAQGGGGLTAPRGACHSRSEVVSSL